MCIYKYRIVSGSFPSFRSSLTLYWSVSCRYKHIPPPLLYYVILFHVIIWKVIVNKMSFNPCFRYSYDFKFNI